MNNAQTFSSCLNLKNYLNYITEHKLEVNGTICKGSFYNGVYNTECEELNSLKTIVSRDINKDTINYELYRF